MVRTASTMLALGTRAPAFRLPDTAGRVVDRTDFDGAPGLLVMFLCRHCPFVKHVERGLAELCAEYERRGVAIVGISSNDANAFPDDAAEGLVQQRREAGFTFPYLYDEDQRVAAAYRAACTPDFFLFDAEHRLVYRGQMDGSRPGNDVPVTGSDLRAALDRLLEGQPPLDVQRPSLGCNIKWKPGNEPDYFPPA